MKIKMTVVMKLFVRIVIVKMEEGQAVKSVQMIVKMEVQAVKIEMTAMKKPEAVKLHPTNPNTHFVKKLLTVMRIVVKALRLKLVGKK